MDKTLIDLIDLLEKDRDEFESALIKAKELLGLSQDTNFDDFYTKISAIQNAYEQEKLLRQAKEEEILRLIENSQRSRTFSAELVPSTLSEPPIISSSDLEEKNVKLTFIDDISPSRKVLYSVLGLAFGSIFCIGLIDCYDSVCNYFQSKPAVVSKISEDVGSQRYLEDVVSTGSYEEGNNSSLDSQDVSQTNDQENIDIPVNVSNTDIISTNNNNLSPQYQIKTIGGPKSQSDYSHKYQSKSLTGSAIIRKNSKPLLFKPDIKTNKDYLPTFVKYNCQRTCSEDKFHPEVECYIHVKDDVGIKRCGAGYLMDKGYIKGKAIEYSEALSDMEFSLDINLPSNKSKVILWCFDTINQKVEVEMILPNCKKRGSVLVE